MCGFQDKRAWSKYTETLITILRTPTGGKVKILQFLTVMSANTG